MEYQKWFFPFFTKYTGVRELYFRDFNGHVWKLPYTMKEDFEELEIVKFYD
jgi:hypothetical protein